MPKKNFLVFGASGMLGSSVTKVLNSIPDAVVTPLSSCDCDIKNPDAVDVQITSANPDVIINCAAYTAVDAAEDDADAADALNHLAPLYIARAANKVNALLIHVSTDYVFDGTASSPCREDDQTAPLGIYGKTKLLGEQAIAATASQYAIIRTQWLYAPHGKNFFLTMLRLFNSRPAISVVSDQIGSPTFTPDLADAIVKVALNFRPELSGIYHFANSGSCSWYDFAISIAALANTSCQISPIPSSQYPTRATRPHFSVLDTSKITSSFNISIPHWRDALNRCFDAMPNS